MERKEYIIKPFDYEMDFGQRGDAIGWKHSCKEIIEVHPGAGFVSRKVKGRSGSGTRFTRYVA